MAKVLYLLILLVGCCYSTMRMLVQGQIPNSAGFISIDCGAESRYYDPELQLFYETDAGFIDSGFNTPVETTPTASRVKQNLRHFPDGKRNCYTLRPTGGKDKKYLIRATFFYGNYDTKNIPPEFDLYIGVNKWYSMEREETEEYESPEIIHVSSTYDIQVCLVKTGEGVPFISALELRPIHMNLYNFDSRSLLLHRRFDIGGNQGQIIRYPQDEYDRMWKGTQKGELGWRTLKNSTSMNQLKDASTYKVPVEVLETAQTGQDGSKQMSSNWTSDSFLPWRFYFHFAEIENLPNGDRRALTVNTSNGYAGGVSLQYLKPEIVIASNPVTGSTIQYTITSSTSYPPILNAVEVFSCWLPVNHTKRPISR